MKYHGLARRHLLPLGFLMRPLLNGGTLGGQKANRKICSRFFGARAGVRSRWRAACDVVLRARARAGGLRCFGRGRLHPGASANRTARAIHFRVSRGFRSPSSRLLPLADRTVVSTAAGPSGGQGCRLRAHLSFAAARALLLDLWLLSGSKPWHSGRPFARRLAPRRSRSPAAQQAVAADGRASSPPSSAFLSPVVKYHGLGLAPP